jgi:hypothetical protein
LFLGSVSNMNKGKVIMANVLESPPFGSEPLKRAGAPTKPYDIVRGVF